jgi:PhnB protein
MPPAKTPSRTASKPKVQPTSPYLTIKGANAAIDLYQKAFGAKVRGRMAAPDGTRVMHADLAINNGTVLLCDEFPEHGGPPAPSAESPSPVAVTIQLKKPDQVDAMFSRAVEAGCKGTMEPNDTFWDARFAMLADPFGHRWMLNAPLPKKKVVKKDAKKKKK